MKQIRSVILFLVSVVLVAFGSQDSKSSENLVKQLEDETKKVGDKIKEVKEVKTAKVEAKKTEKKPVQKQPVQQPVASNVQAQPQPQVQQQAVNTSPQQPVALTENSANQAFALNEGNKVNSKKENRKNRRNNKNGLSKTPKHSRLRDDSSAVPKETAVKVKSQDSAPKSSGSSSNSGSSSGSSSSGSSSSGGGDSSSSE